MWLFSQAMVVEGCEYFLSPRNKPLVYNLEKHYWNKSVLLTDVHRLKGHGALRHNLWRFGLNSGFLRKSPLNTTLITPKMIIQSKEYNRGPDPLTALQHIDPLPQTWNPIQKSHGIMNLL